jgi:hypothetical protein
LIGHIPAFINTLKMVFTPAIGLAPTPSFHARANKRCGVGREKAKRFPPNGSSFNWHSSVKGLIIFKHAA